MEIKYTKNLNNPLNQNVNLTKRARFASIVDNLCLCLCLLQQNQNADQISVAEKKSVAEKTGRCGEVI